MPASARTIRARKRRYYEQHREELLLKNKIKYHANSERIREASRRDYALNKERRKKLDKIRAKKPQVRVAKRKSNAKYYAKHRGDILLKMRMNYHANLEASRAAAREKYKEKHAPLTDSIPEEEAPGPSYCVKHVEGLVLKLQKVESSKYSEADRRQQNLEEIVSKVAGGIDEDLPSGAHRSMLELRQGEGMFRDSSDLVPTIVESCQRDCEHGSSLVIPGVAPRTGHFAKGGGEGVLCHNNILQQKHVACEISGELNLAQGGPMHKSGSSGGSTSPRVESHSDHGSLLAKSQQKVDEMLTQLESGTAAKKRWEEISSAYQSKGTDSVIV